MPGRSLSSTLAADRLGVWSVMSFVGAAVAALVVVGGVVSTAWAVTGVSGLPLAFVGVGVVLGVFCVGYVAVARRVRNSGAFYPYVALGWGKAAGVGAAFVAVPAYGCMQVATFGALGPVTSATLSEVTGLEVSWWAAALVAWGLVGVLGLARVDVNGRVLATALVAEVSVIGACDLLDVAHPHDGRLSVATLSPSSLAGAGLGVAFAVAVTGFVGFENVAVFSEETRRYTSTVRRATYASLAVMVGVYAGSAWAMSVRLGPEHLHAAAVAAGADLPFTTAGGGTVLLDVGHALLVTSLFSAALSYQNSVARYLFALGRERVLPAWLGRTAAVNNSPRVASLIQSAIGLAVILGYAVSGADPMVRLFFWGGTIGAFGVLILITLTSFSVVGYFRRHGGHGENTWTRLVAPATAGVALAGIVWLIGDNFPALLGVPPTSALAWAVPTAFAVCFTAGATWGRALRAWRPGVYAAIGLGATPATARVAVSALDTTGGAR